MTLLHKKSKVPAKIGRGGDNGIVEWNGQSNRFINMPNISKTVAINKGDSILTSSNSDIFPENLLIGIIDTFTINKASGFYDIKIKAAANFSTTNYVQVVENVQQKETRETLKKAKKELNEL
jgi:rod shape-determining protein MreC